MKTIKIDINENDYQLIHQFARQSNIDIDSYIKRSLVFLMNVDDHMKSKNSFIEISENKSIIKKITKKQIDLIK